MANAYFHESVSKFVRGAKQLLLIGGLAFLVACSSSSSTDNAASGKSAMGLTTAQVAKFESERVGLMASLAKLYPNGQLTPEQAAAASKALAQNPAALHSVSKSAKQDVMFSQAGVSLVGSDFLPVYRIQNTTLAGSYFFTIYESEKTAALAANPDWKYEGPAFYATTLEGEGLSPVWRFRNKVNGSYLFTIYESERADIANNYAATFEYEGVSWYASQTAAAGYSPLHRFRNLTNGTYLFSAYETEKNEIIANYPTIFAYEGISYYVRVSPPPTNNNITAVVKDGNIVLPASATSGSNTVASLKAGGVQIDSSDSSVANLKTNDIVHIAPRTGGLAFPFVGKVTTITTVSGKQQVRLIPANVEDVYDKLSWDIDTSRSDAVIAGVIAPQNARASFSQTNTQPKFGGMFKPQLTVTDSLKADGTKISGKVEISQDIVIKGKKVTVTATADVNNLSVKSRGEYYPEKILTGGGWGYLTAVITGDVGGGIALKGSLDGSLGDIFTNTDVWEQLKWNGQDMFTLEGLDSKDKAGRIPLGGLVVVPYTAIAFTGNLPDKSISLLSAAPSTVIWLYLDVNGNVTMEGEAGWRAADYKFEKGYEFVASGIGMSATKIDKVTKGRQELFAKGTIKAVQRVGVSTAADIFVGGVRPANVNAFIGAEWTGSIEGEGVAELVPTQNKTGIFCVKNNIWIGSQLNASARIKVKVDLFKYLTAEGLAQWEYTEPHNAENTYFEKDLGSSCVTGGLFSITADVQGPDAFIPGNSFVNINFTPAFNNTAVASKTKHWWVKASCAGCADINVEIPAAQAGIGAISLPTGKSYTLTLEAKSDDFGVIKSATTTVNVTAAPTASFIAAANNSSCSNINLTATAAATGGRAITSYAWAVQRTGVAVQNYIGNPVAAVPLPSCGTTAITLTVTDSLGYTTTVTQTVNTTNLGATVTSITPNATILNTATVFTVTGTNLPATAILAVADATCLGPVNNPVAGTGFSQTCTPTIAGVKNITVKAASGGAVIDNTRTVNVTVAPISGNIELPAISYLRGTNVALSTAETNGADTLMNAPPYTPAANAAEWDFTVPTTGNYELFATYASNLSRPVTISFDGTVAFANAMGAVTGGWVPANRQTLSQGIVQLTAGAKTMRVARGDVFPHIKGFTLVPVVAGTFNVPANLENGTPFTVPAGMSRCTFLATGTWNGGASYLQTDANGIGPTQNTPWANLTWAMGSASALSLVATSSNNTVAIGSSSTLTLTPSTVLSFRMNDTIGTGGYSDNYGSLSVSYSCSNTPVSAGSISVAANTIPGGTFQVPTGATSCQLSATGTWSAGPNAPLSSQTADGAVGSNALDLASRGAALPSAAVGALVVRHSSNSLWELVGSSKTISVASLENLTFMMNDATDSGYTDSNTGSLAVGYNCN